MKKIFYVSFSLLFFSLLLGLFVLSFSSPKKTGEVSVKVSPHLPPKITEPKMRESKEIVPPPSRVSLLVVGDIMLDRSVFLKTKAAKNWEHPFLLADPLFHGKDLAVANLEGPITRFTSIANGTGGARFTFTFSPNFVEPLKRFDVLSLANNHALNFGEKGLVETRNFLTGAGIQYFGDPNNNALFVATTTEKNGIRIGWVGYHQLVEQGFDRVLKEVTRLEPEVDVLIAIPHWGTEYVTDKPTALQTKEARALIDAGVDMIFGAHPHVIQPIEIYKEKVIFYSLGNFIFDQYFSKETLTGLAVNVNFEKDDEGLRFETILLPLQINSESQVFLASSSTQKNVLEFLSRVSIVDNSMKLKIREGKF